MHITRMCFIKIATVDCMNKIIGRNIMKMRSIYVFPGNIRFQCRLIFSFIFGFTKIRPSIFDILSAKLVQSLRNTAVIIQIALNNQFIFKIKYLAVFDNFWELLYEMVSTAIYETLVTYR